MPLSASSSKDTMPLSASSSKDDDGIEPPQERESCSQAKAGQADDPQLKRHDEDLPQREAGEIEALESAMRPGRSSSRASRAVSNLDGCSPVSAAGDSISLSRANGSAVPPSTPVAPRPLPPSAVGTVVDPSLSVEPNTIQPGDSLSGPSRRNASKVRLEPLEPFSTKVDLGPPLGLRPPSAAGQLRGSASDALLRRGNKGQGCAPFLASDFGDAASPDKTGRRGLAASSSNAGRRSGSVPLLPALGADSPDKPTKRHQRMLAEIVGPALECSLSFGNTTNTAPRSGGQTVPTLALPQQDGHGGGGASSTSATQFADIRAREAGNSRGDNQHPEAGQMLSSRGRVERLQKSSSVAHERVAMDALHAEPLSSVLATGGISLPTVDQQQFRPTSGNGAFEFDVYTKGCDVPRPPPRNDVEPMPPAPSCGEPMPPAPSGTRPSMPSLSVAACKSDPASSNTLIARQRPPSRGGSRPSSAARCTRASAQ